MHSLCDEWACAGQVQGPQPLGGRYGCLDAKVWNENHLQQMGVHAVIVSADANTQRDGMAFKFW